MRVLALCGSLQKNSSNLRLLREAQKRAPIGCEIERSQLLEELPHFNPDISEVGVPEVARRWRSAVEASDALLISSPEYGHSLPGVLKNAIDWLIPTGELFQKVVAITCCVRHEERGKKGLKALKKTLLAVDARLAWNQPLLEGDDFELRLDELLTRLVETRRETLQ